MVHQRWEGWGSHGTATVLLRQSLAGALTAQKSCSARGRSPQPLPASASCQRVSLVGESRINTDALMRRGALTASRDKISPHKKARQEGQPQPAASHTWGKCVLRVRHCVHLVVGQRIRCSPERRLRVGVVLTSPRDTFVGAVTERLCRLRDLRCEEQVQGLVQSFLLRTSRGLTTTEAVAMSGQRAGALGGRPEGLLRQCPITEKHDTRLRVELSRWAFAPAKAALGLLRDWRLNRAVEVHRREPLLQRRVSSHAGDRSDMKGHPRASSGSVQGTNLRNPARSYLFTTQRSL